MDKRDLKLERKDLCAPPPGRFVQVLVPQMTFLVVDGHGDPDTSEAYRHAVEALFAVSYAAKFLSRRAGRDYVVLPSRGCGVRPTGAPSSGAPSRSGPGR